MDLEGKPKSVREPGVSKSGFENQYWGKCRRVEWIFYDLSE